jgi:hypothetical protein
MRIYFIQSYNHYLAQVSTNPDFGLTSIASLAGNGLMFTLFILERRRAEKAEERERDRTERFMNQIVDLASKVDKVATTVAKR